MAGDTTDTDVGLAVPVGLPPPLPLPPQVKLDKVLGLTVADNCSLSSNASSGTVIYPAGCVCVLLDIRKNKQSHIINTSKKTLTSISFSRDGKYIVSGECGHHPCLRVWDAKTLQQLTEFDGHKYGINCVAFSPNSAFVVSVGSQHDMIVNVFDWKNQVKVASNKVSSKVRSLCFSEDGSYFVTVGVRHVKFWYLDVSSRHKNSVDAIPLMGRSAILGDQRNNVFVDVGCGRGSMSESTYSITESGLLCEFNSKRLLDKWVELRTTKANCLSVGETMICIGCADGIIRVFNPINLHFICTLPRPHSLGVDVASVTPRNDPVTGSSALKYADTVAITLLEETRKVVSVYSDHSMYVWDVKDAKKVGKTQSYLYHSNCIWAVEPYSVPSSKSESLLPPGTFLTCSSDDTIRVWNLDANQNLDGFVYKRNIFSHDLLKIIYMDPEYKFLCDSDAGNFNDNDNNSKYDGKNGVRCLSISANGKHLASGDRSGNIMVKDLASQVDICKIEAHDSEVLCLEFSDPSVSGGHFFLCSASRDRLIHLFDVNHKYSFVTTLDDHNSAITAIKFVPNPDSERLHLLSCGADKSVIFRKLTTGTTPISFSRDHHVVGKTTLYDMEIDGDKTCVLTACQDRQIRVYDIESGKLTSTLKGSLSEDGTLIKIAIDPSGEYYATSSTDKTLSVFEYQTGECVATASGHSELITGLKFSLNGRSLISVSGDSCIFVWKLPPEIANNIATKLGLPPVPPEKPAFISGLRSISSERTETESDESRVIPRIKLSSPGEDVNQTRIQSPTKVVNKWLRKTDLSFLRSPSESDQDVSRNEDTDSVRTNSIRSDEEVPSSSSDIVYYPQDDSLQNEGNFEIKTDQGMSNGSTSNSNRHPLMNSKSVPNINDLMSDEEDVSEKSAPVHDQKREEVVKQLTTHNPLYLSSENLSETGSKSRQEFPDNNVSLRTRGEGKSRRKENRSSLSSQHLLTSRVGGDGGEGFTSSDLMQGNSSLSRSTSVSSIVGGVRGPSSRKREELTKAVSEAKKKLESFGWKSNKLSSSRSVADLRQYHSIDRRSLRPSPASQSISYNTLPASVTKRSISMSDLSFGPRRLSLLPSEAGVPAPVWDTHRGGNDSFASSSGGGGLRKSTSISDLVKARNKSLQSKRPPQASLWATPSPLPLSTFGTGSRSRSGRASAPPAKLRINGGSIHATQSSDDESSTDDESSSSFIRTLRPGTPPKPSIMRQVRRSSTSHVMPNNTLPSFRQHHHLPPQTESRGRTRKLWDNFELRSSKSEYNLNFAGRSESRSASRVNLAGSFFENNRIDFASENPATIELSQETCEQVSEELNFLAIFVRKLLKRSQALGDHRLTDILNQGINRTYQTLNAVAPLPSSTSSLPRSSSQVHPMQRSSTEASVSGSFTGDAPPVPMNLLVQYSDALLQIMQQRMANNTEQQQQQQQQSNNLNSSSSTNL